MFSNELAQKRDVRAADVAPPIPILFRHNSSVSEKRLELEGL